MKENIHVCFPYLDLKDNPNAHIKCHSFTDTNLWLNLVWQDKSSLLVKFCPFCGKSAEETFKEI